MPNLEAFRNRPEVSLPQEGESIGKTGRKVIRMKVHGTMPNAKIWIDHGWASPVSAPANRATLERVPDRNIGELQIRNFDHEGDAVEQVVAMSHPLENRVNHRQGHPPHSGH